jgi:flagellar hook-associated protein 3 FlgL
MRVGENTTLNTVRDSLSRSRLRMNELQKQNATLKRVNAPSDDPVGNTKLMSIRNETLDNEQFERNSNLAKTFLNYTDSSLEEITNLLGRAKELAIGQASSAANGPESRLMVAEEIRNIVSEVTSIANRRLGDRHIFSGYKTHTQPFDDKMGYKGDDGKIMVEVQKDVFVGMNIPGKELFLGATPPPSVAGAEAVSAESGQDAMQPELAMKRPTTTVSGEDMFQTLEALRVGLMTNDVDQIRSTLEPLDRISNRVITTRAQVGARTAGIDTALANMGKKNADVIQVVSDMAREESVLRASLQASNKLIQPTLLEFLR